VPVHDILDAQGRPAEPLRPRLISRERYLQLLGWSFALFGSLRVFSYLPTLWAIHLSGNSSQHSMLTWATWLGANLTMAAWLSEHNGGRLNRAAVVSLVNAGMCAATLTMIACYRG
jgi:hypothetical protein